MKIEIEKNKFEFINRKIKKNKQIILKIKFNFLINYYFYFKNVKKITFILYF